MAGFKLTQDEKRWVLYDAANSAFILIVVTTLGALYFKEHMGQEISRAMATASWGYSNSLAALLAALSGPLIGQWLDHRNTQQRGLLLFTVLGALVTALLAWLPLGSWLLFLGTYLLARLFFALANICYDALLLKVTTLQRMDRVSAAGYGWGYIGSVIPFLAIPLAGMLWPAESGLDPRVGQAAFLIVAAWWLLLSVPLLSRAVGGAPRIPAERKENLLGATWREIRAHPQALRFLLAYFLYIDGVFTIMVMAVAFGKDAGLTSGDLIQVILAIQIVSFPAALLAGRLAERIGRQRVILIGLAIYMGVTVGAWWLYEVSWNRELFWILGMGIALAQGGLQAMSRSQFAQLIPAGQSATWFGLFNASNRFAVILGPLMLGLVTQLTGSSQDGVLTLIPLFVVGGWLLIKSGETAPGISAPAANNGA
uniref:Putative MFS superfamily transporter n=1 Tax=Magnetococcus massalia (strain MO-1) TaxID=451514 RepID=A0A1S7LCM1_MAGMO|nr:Putative MFS superfamily transporter [Candidatus Magnetococcus massalia]